MKLDDFLTTPEASRLTGHTCGSLRVMRTEHRGPKFEKFFGRVLYRRADVIAYARSRQERQPEQVA